MLHEGKVKGERLGRGNLILIHSSSFESAAMGVVRPPSQPTERPTRPLWHANCPLATATAVHENEALVPFSPLSLALSRDMAGKEIRRKGREGEETHTVFGNLPPRPHYCCCWNIVPGTIKLRGSASAPGLEGLPLCYSGVRISRALRFFYPFDGNFLLILIRT